LTKVTRKSADAGSWGQPIKKRIQEENGDIAFPRVGEGKKRHQENVVRWELVERLAGRKARGGSPSRALKKNTGQGGQGIRLGLQGQKGTIALVANQMGTDTPENFDRVLSLRCEGGGEGGRRAKKLLGRS